MITVIGVRFKRAGKVYYFDPGDVPVEIGQSVVVETVRGVELGEIAVPMRTVADEEVVQPLKKVIRVATDSDLHQVTDNQHREQEALVFAQEKVHEMGLEMKLVEVEYTFDKSKLVFYFTADKRIDFRELVKELAARFRTRIELRQIGVRDEAKMLGGLGVCGQGLCCATWIGDFAPVSIRHAKDQDLSMNPNKISGVCGRLKCCLRYESEAYEDARERQPKLGECVMAPAGEARIVAVNLLRENCTLQVADGPRFSATWEEVKQFPIKSTGHCCSNCAKTAVREANEAATPEAPPILASEPVVASASPSDTDGNAAPNQPAPAKNHRKPRRVHAERPHNAPAPKPPHVTQEIAAAGTDEDAPTPHKRRRWRRRKPRSNESKEATGVSPA